MSSGTEAEVRSLVLELFLDGDESFPLEPDTDLIEGGICDSMGLVQLAAALEEKFSGLSVDDQDVNREAMGSVAAIVELLRRAGAAA